jgi:hypothetical protein
LHIYSIVNERGGMNPPTVLEPTALFARETFCGADRDRTDDLRLAKPALSQLSYSPFWRCGAPENRVGQGRVELPTSRLSGVRSNHLSYWPSQVTACAALGPLPEGKHARLACCFRGRSGTAFENAALAPWKLNRTRCSSLRQWVLTSRSCSGDGHPCGWASVESENSLERR